MIQEIKKRVAQMIVVDHEAKRILLAYHKTGEMADYYMGFLDEMRKDEPAQDAATRIAQEQCGIIVPQAELRALLIFTGEEFDSVDEYEYYATVFEGEPQETDAIRPEWFDFDKIPYSKMPADDAIWYPPFLSGKLQRGEFHFAAGMKNLLRHELYEVDSL